MVKITVEGPLVHVLETIGLTLDDLHQSTPTNPFVLANSDREFFRSHADVHTMDGMLRIEFQELIRLPER